MRLPEIPPSPPWSTSSASCHTGPPSIVEPRLMTDPSSPTDEFPLTQKSVSLFRALLPATHFVARYPLHVLLTKTAFSENLNPHVSSHSDYLMVRPPLTENEDDSYLPPGRRWLKEAPKHLYKIREPQTSPKEAIAKVQDDQGTWKVEPVLQLPMRPAYLAVAKHIYRRYGWTGFFRALPTAHCMELIYLNLARQLQKGMDAAYIKWLGQLDEDDWDNDDDDFKTRFRRWFLTDEGRASVVKMLASTASAAITYPLSVVMLRQIVYEPFDHQPLGFIDMARLTVIYDGPKTFIGGILPYTGLKILGGIVGSSARAAVAAAGWEDSDAKLGTYVAQQSRAITEILFQPVLHHIQYSQVFSYIPGLLSGQGQTLLQAYKTESPVIGQIVHTPFTPLLGNDYDVSPRMS
eukprot:Blabericola_migrator_1__7744@NODE_3958_length_1408_cov_123_739746_g119_i1_p1_GENE_NODE_3958_length_1408_cov_123_739746_g119_i1NODE_3958_length_1408_cov_123_739746_g119_i1_p1_ORF_typecomplete_len406_score59_29Mito_carr/PF00153_27/0_18Mito_carr/PF00153_27/0_0012DUF2397/PF09660_10/0_2_NODE_3958_length_1408_cov_123_739746_g119_i1821299